MSENVNVNSDVIIDAEFVPNTVIAKKELPDVGVGDAGKVAMVNAEGKWDKGDVPTELPAVTSADYEKILQVDENGNWVAVPDRFHLGDVWEVPQGTTYISVITSFSQILTPAITIGLSKYIDDDVKWFEIATDVNTSKITVVDKNGSVVLSNIAFNDLFDIKYSWSQMSRDYINLALYIKSAYQATLTPYLGEMLFFVFNNTYLRMIATKPT